MNRLFALGMPPFRTVLCSVENFLESAIGPRFSL